MTSQNNIVDTDSAGASDKGVGCRALVRPKTVLLPFRLKIYDDNPENRSGWPKEAGPFWIEIPCDEIAGGIPKDFPGAHWEQVAREERYALDQIRANLEASLDIDALKFPPNAQVEARRQ